MFVQAQALQHWGKGPRRSHSYLEDCLPLSSKVEFKLISDQKFHFYLHPKEICHMCTTRFFFFLMFIVVLFVKDKNWKQSNDQKQKMNTLWYIHKIGCCSILQEELMKCLLLHKTRRKSLPPKSSFCSF